MQILPHYYRYTFCFHMYRSISSSIISQGIQSALFQTKYQTVDLLRCNLIVPVFFLYPSKDLILTWKNKAFVHPKLGESSACVPHREQCFICELTNHLEERTGGSHSALLSDRQEWKRGGRLEGCVSWWGVVPEQRLQTVTATCV